jgi:hypothetical protein
MRQLAVSLFAQVGGEARVVNPAKRDNVSSRR